MDITTIGGIIFGIALMAFAVISTEGIEGVKAFWDLPAFLLVFGGTFAALLVNFPLSRVIGVIKVLKKY